MGLCPMLRQDTVSLFKGSLSLFWARIDCGNHRGRSRRKCLQSSPAKYVDDDDRVVQTGKNNPDIGRYPYTVKRLIARQTVDART